jgi:hypothetical protein
MAIASELHSLSVFIPSGKYRSGCWVMVTPTGFVMHCMYVIAQGTILLSIEYEAK